MRRAQREAWDCQLVVLSRDEQKQAQCKLRYPEVEYLLGDVTDPEGLALAMSGCETVIHAAAIKYIPEAELNCREAIRINVQGMLNVAHLAWMNSVGHVIGISTDKAAAPVNVYGMTKALMERTFAEMSGKCYDTQFNCVRYGNVIGSTGSVIPVFMRQMQDQGFVTITDPGMTRYWITVDQAIDLILEAYDDPDGDGDVLIKNPMSLSIGNIADVVAGNNIKVIGRRPGEKTHEHMISKEESLRVTCSVLTGPNDRMTFYLHPASHPANDKGTWELTSDGAYRWAHEDMAIAIRDSVLV